MKCSILFSGLFLGCLLNGFAQTRTGYSIIHTFPIQSTGGWDYLAVNGNNLYVSHGTQVNILEKNTGDSLGIIYNISPVFSGNLRDAKENIVFIPAGDDDISFDIWPGFNRHPPFPATGAGTVVGKRISSTGNG